MVKLATLKGGEKAMTEIRDEVRRLILDENYLWEEFYQRSNPENILRAEQISSIGKKALLNIKPSPNRKQNDLVQSTFWFLNQTETLVVRCGNEMLINFVSGVIEGIPPVDNSFILSSWVTPKRLINMDKESYWGKIKEIPIPLIEVAELSTFYDQTLKSMVGKYNRQLRVIMMIQVNKQNEGDEVRLLKADLVTRGLRAELRENNENNGLEGQEITP